MAINHGKNDSGVKVYRTPNQIINMIDVRERKLENLETREDRTSAMDRKIEELKKDLAELRSERLAKMAAAAVQNGEAVCIGCGCTDSEGCAEGCWWLKVDYSQGLGVCSECPDKLNVWKLGDRAGNRAAMEREPKA